MKKHYRDRSRTLTQMFNEQSGICPYCGDKMTLRSGFKQATIEHIIPKSKGGPNKEFNYMAVCSKCNSASGILPLANFLIMKMVPQHA